MTPDSSDPATSEAPSTPEGGTHDALWYKDAIVYQLHVKAFRDANRDGIGDFAGLTEKLDYLRDLGVTAVMLMPFYPSPLRDDGYDVADYREVHPSYGTLQEFRRFVREAHRRGLRVITELVMNHSSDLHPWFQRARRAPRGSPEREFYVWSDDPKKYAGTGIIFPEAESSNWAWDNVAQAHYWHRFFSHQPDLNFDHPEVLREWVRIMRHWLDLGVDGLRLDGVPYLVEREGTSNENLPETHAVLRRLRAWLEEHHPGRPLLAEANLWPEEVCRYFGNGDECHMAFHFPLMPRLFLAIAMEDRHPVVDIVAQTPDIPAECQWAIFLRNHDELTLEAVTDRERDYMYRVFANDPNMRLNLGIRRRLAPLMENERPKIELISFLLMTLPGTPIIYYGDEIGMGDNVYLGGRNSVRTPMQWSPDRNAGFSKADPQSLFMPPIMDPVYGYQSVNVESQLRSASSLLHWTRRLIAVRKSYRAFGRGTLTFLQPGNRKILAYIREHDGQAVLCVANLSRLSQAVELDLTRYEGRVPVEITGRESFPPIGKLPYLLTLPGHGYFAFELAVGVRSPIWHEQRFPNRTLPVVVLSAQWREALTGQGLRDIRSLAVNLNEQRLREEILLPFMRDREWFTAHAGSVSDLAVDDLLEWATPEGHWLLAVLRAEWADQRSQRFLVPLALDWETRNYDPLERLGPWAVARIRQKERMGVLYSALGDPEFARALARAAGSNAEVAVGDKRLRFSSSAVYAELTPSIDEEVRTPPLEQSNTSVFFGNRLYLKAYRRLHYGVNPDLEMARFLTEVSAFAHIAPLAGAVELVDPATQAEPITLAILQKYVEHQGDAWNFTVEYLDRTLAAPSADGGTSHAFYLKQMELLGQRVAQLHRALARISGDPPFDPEPFTRDAFLAWTAEVATAVERALASLRQAATWMGGSLTTQVEELLARRAELLERLRTVQPAAALVRTRYHGDLHLGQVLIAQNDFVIIDFEGDPRRPIGQWRGKHCPMRDMAGMLYSITKAGDTVRRRAPEHAAADAALEHWERESSAALQRGYRHASAGLASMPTDDVSWRTLLNLFTLERTVYELQYELQQLREPALPLRSLLQLSS
jgi:maltose alpha-D-glucosyltransferase/alpha-amylase